MYWPDRTTLHRTNRKKCIFGFNYKKKLGRIKWSVCTNRTLKITDFGTKWWWQYLINFWLISYTPSYLQLTCGMSGSYFSCSPALLSGCFLAGGCITKCSHEYHCKNILKETFVYLLSHSDWRRVMLLLLWNPINNGDRPDRYKLATRLTLRFMMNWYGEIFVLRASLCGKYWEVV